MVQAHGVADIEHRPDVIRPCLPDCSQMPPRNAGRTWRPLCQAGPLSSGPRAHPPELAAPLFRTSSCGRAVRAPSHVPLAREVVEEPLLLLLLHQGVLRRVSLKPTGTHTAQRLATSGSGSRDSFANDSRSLTQTSWSRSSGRGQREQALLMLLRNSCANQSAMLANARDLTLSNTPYDGKRR